MDKGYTKNGHFAPTNAHGRDVKSRAKANATDVFATTGQTPSVPRSITSDTHRNKLRMIAEDVIKERGYATVLDSFTLEELGFPPSQNPALLIPWWGVHRGSDPKGYQIRPNIPMPDKRKPDKFAKYLFPKGHKNFLDVHPRNQSDVKSPKKPLYMAESPIKADTLTSQGLCAVALAGTTGWKWTNEEDGKVALACFDSIAIEGRIIYLVPDSDYKSNKAVRNAINGLARYLLSRKAAKVLIIELPDAEDGAKQGVDDYFAAGGDLTELYTFISLPGKSKPEVGKADAESVNLEAGPSEFPLNDIGNGKRFAKEHRPSLRYCSTDKNFYFYWGGIWKEDAHGEAERRAKKTAEGFIAEAQATSDDDKRARLLKHAVTLTQQRSRETMLKDASSEPGMTVTLEDFDTDLDLFNCKNGTLNLKTSEFLVHNPDNLLTRQSPVVYDPEAPCELWRQCVERWMMDADKCAFIQELMGITLSGRVYEELFIFLYGAGDNGKSRFLGILEHILGTYAHKTSSETIMQSHRKRSSNAPSQDVLELKGARLVTAHEIDEKQEFNTTRIKDLTGRDRITARGMYARRETTFQPQFTLWMFGNGKPVINDSSQGMWRRPKLIDFGPPIPKNERDPQLRQKLEAESSGILNWMLEGLARVEARGGKIETPESVITATANYQQQQNPVALFLEDECTRGDAFVTPASDLWKAWREWCKANCEEPGKQIAFGTALERLGLESGRPYFGKKQKRSWKGVRLISAGDELDFDIGSV